MKRNALVMATALGLFLTGCSDSNSVTKEVPQNIKELVQDYSTHKIEVEAASITSNQLIVTDTDGDKTIYDLPEDEFFVSIAPFVERTHD